MKAVSKYLWVEKPGRLVVEEVAGQIKLGYWKLYSTAIQFLSTAPEVGSTTQGIITLCFAEGGKDKRDVVALLL